MFRGYVYSIHARLLGGRVVHIERGFRLFFYYVQGLRSPQLA